MNNIRLDGLRCLNSWCIEICGLQLVCCAVLHWAPVMCSFNRVNWVALWLAFDPKRPNLVFDDQFTGLSHHSWHVTAFISSWFNLYCCILCIILQLEVGNSAFTYLTACPNFLLPFLDPCFICLKNCAELSWSFMKRSFYFVSTINILLYNSEFRFQFKSEVFGLNYNLYPVISWNFSCQ